jgi:uncharacterized membrane protein YphA (DoxX/SURF4 family)
MAIDRQGAGLAIVRISMGVVFLFTGVNKYKWFFDASILQGQLSGWMQNAAPGSIAHSYLTRVALPYAATFARLVPLGEIACGVALLLGIWTPLFAFIAFLMVLNYHIAAGVIFKYSFLTFGYGLPILGPTLGLTIGGIRLPWSIRSGS